MESRGLQLRDKTERSITLKTQWSQAETIRLDTLLLKTSVYYPNQELSAETLSEFRDAFKNLASLHGIEALESALRKLKLVSKFFPHPAEINDAIVAEKELAGAKGRWDRQEKYMREKADLERIERENTEYVDMQGVVTEFYAKKSMVTGTPPPPAGTEYCDPSDRVMASFSEGLEAGKQYEPKVVEQIMSWRAAKQ